MVGEIDGKDDDARSVIRHMKETLSHLLVVNGGGVIDFIDNPLPDATPTAFSGRPKMFYAILVKACHEKGFPPTKICRSVDNTST